MWEKVYALNGKPSQDQKIYILSTLIHKLLQVLTVLLLN